MFCIFTCDLTDCSSHLGKSSYPKWQRQRILPVFSHLGQVSASFHIWFLSSLPCANKSSNQGHSYMLVSYRNKSRTIFNISYPRKKHNKVSRTVHIWYSCIIIKYTWYSINHNKSHPPQRSIFNVSQRNTKSVLQSSIKTETCCSVAARRETCGRAAPRRETCFVTASS